MSIEEEILNVLRSATEASVSTFAGEYIRSRMMHYAVTEDLTIYLATMRNDPKVLHITNNPSITIMVLNKVGDPGKYMDLKEFGRWSEVEIQGKAEIVRERGERERGLKLLAERSPVVKLLTDIGREGVLDVIRVKPLIIKYRRVSDILEGKPPIVLDYTVDKPAFEEFNLLKEKVIRWYHAIRAPFLVAGIPPVLLGALIAYVETGVLYLSRLTLTLMGVILAHISLNLLNDYYDHKLRTDIVNVDYIRPFSGGSRVIQLGLLSPLEVLTGGLIAMIVTIAIGIYLTLVSSIYTLIVMAIGLFLIISYNVPPLRLSARGIGEIACGLGFGSIITLGSYIVQTGYVSIHPLIVSIPLALLVAQILFVNEFPDYRADKDTGRLNLLVRLGRGRGRIIYHALYIITYLYIIFLYLYGEAPIYTLLSLIGVPISTYGMIYVNKYYDQPMDMIPGYISAIMTYMIVGFAMAAGYIIYIFRNIYVLSVSALLIALYMLYEYMQIRYSLTAFMRLKAELGQS